MSMQDYTLGFVATDYDAILSVEERVMETLSIEELMAQILGERL